MKECEECYSALNRVTPLLHPRDCLKNHTQYICSSCGRCICIQKDPKRSMQRWQFPFKSLAIAKLYLRTADVTTEKPCGIYEIEDKKGRKSYKIFASEEDLKQYLEKNKEKKCAYMAPVYRRQCYQVFDRQQIRKLSSEEIEIYINEKLSVAQEKEI